MSSIEITLEGGGIIDVFHNDWDQCEARELLHVGSLSGWYGGVGSSVTPDLKRFRRHGAFPGRTIRSGRKMDLVLNWHHSIGGSAEDGYTAAARLASSIAWDEGPYLMTVNEDGFELQCNVQLDGEPQFSSLDERSEDEFSMRLPLLATDPFLYSPPITTLVSGYSRTPVALTDFFAQGQFNEHGEQVFGWTEPAQSPVALVNSGTADAYPVVKVVADAPAGVRLLMGGSSVDYVGPLFQQSPLYIDYKKGSATLNGRDVSFNLRNRQWTSVPPHTAVQAQIAFLGGSGYGYAEATLRSTWI